MTTQIDTNSFERKNLQFASYKPNPKYDLSIGKIPDNCTVTNQMRFNIVDGQFPRPVVVFGPDRVSVDPSVEVDEAARVVLNAIEDKIKWMIEVAVKVAVREAVKEERNACAKIAAAKIPIYERFEDQRAAGNTARAIKAMIEARDSSRDSSRGTNEIL